MTRWGDFRQTAERFGMRAVAYDLAMRALNRLVVFRVFVGVRADTLDPAFLELDERFRFTLLTEAMLARFTTDEFEIAPAFLRQALERGDECYGILDGNVLASYGWYSSAPTRIYPPDLVLHFNPEYIYTYKAFTHPNYRGRRLHAIAMTKALQAYLARHFKGLVCYVESTNFSSLKSVYRMGYKDIGKIYMAKVFHHYWLYPDEACKRYRFYLEPVPLSTALAAPAVGD
jgi:GNAT superfamily N-acetyltransferase